LVKPSFMKKAYKVSVCMFWNTDDTPACLHADRDLADFHRFNLEKLKSVFIRFIRLICVPFDQEFRIPEFLYEVCGLVKPEFVNSIYNSSL